MAVKAGVVVTFVLVVAVVVVAVVVVVVTAGKSLGEAIGDL